MVWLKLAVFANGMAAMMWAVPQLSGASPVHWAFQHVIAPTPPGLGVESPPRSPIDAFVRAELEKRNLAPAAPAAPRELLRRLAFDLTGLPPTFEQVEAFARVARAAEDIDDYPAAISAATGRLLAAPGFGEKWARHWLDVARYSDTKGYVFQEERRYPFAYGYRDWVIKAFNADMPYDAFVTAQIAADQIEGGRSEDLAAMGFLTLGRRFLNREPDIIDDRIDVVTRGMLGLTVACARCHDHKFDPIPTQDYYSMYGVFQSSTEPSELPLVCEPEQGAEYEKFKSRLAELEHAVADFKTARHAELLTAESIASYLAAAWDSREKTGRDLRRFAQDRKLYPAALKRWRDLLFSENKEMPVLGLWRELATLDAETEAAEIEQALNAATKENAAARSYFEKHPLRDIAGVHAAFGRMLTEVPSDGIAGVLEVPGGIGGLSPDTLVRDYSVKHRNEVRQRQRAVDKFRATDAGAPTRAMALVDRDQPIEPVVFERGNPGRRGERVPRQFLSILSPAERVPFTHGSGRLELARAIADPQNPLTARVMANRIWMHLTGVSLVESPSDFGVRTEQPRIPGLLDHLAAYFVDSGWSMKRLIQHIVLSETYQQSTIGGAVAVAGAAVAAMDPENRLLARATRRRLPFEGLRDAMLTVSGAMNPRMFGRAVALEGKPAANRRTIYGLVDRQNLAGVFRTFDFATPDAHCPRRHETTVPQQALFLMNNAFAQDMAAGLVSLPAVAAAGDDAAARIEALFRAVHARNPTGEETSLGEQFIEDSIADGLKVNEAWSAYAQALLASNEFAFCD